MSDIIVVDDFISKDYADHIEQLVNEKDFPLHFRKGIVTNEDEHEGNVDGFIHMLYEVQKPVSPRFPLIYPMVLSITEATGIKWNVLERLRFNFMLGNSTSKIKHHAPHTDNYTPHWSAIYYVHDCDGDTFFFDQKLTEFTEEESYRITYENNWTIKKRVSPKKGRLVMFDGVRFHASSFTKTKPFRCVLNMNFS